MGTLRAVALPLTFSGMLMYGFGDTKHNQFVEHWQAQSARSPIINCMRKSTAVQAGPLDARPCRMPPAGLLSKLSRPPRGFFGGPCLEAVLAAGLRRGAFFGAAFIVPFFAALLLAVFAMITDRSKQTLLKAQFIRSCTCRCLNPLLKATSVSWPVSEVPLPKTEVPPAS